jgi:hypothetical protein
MRASTSSLSSTRLNIAARTVGGTIIALPYARSQAAPCNGFANMRVSVRVPSMLFCMSADSASGKTASTSSVK